MARLMSYWEAANVREPTHVEFYSAVTGKSFVLQVKLIRIENGMLVYVDETEFGHSCMQKNYNVWDVFGWRPWDDMPTEEERDNTRWIYG